MSNKLFKEKYGEHARILNEHEAAITLTTNVNAFQRQKTISLLIPFAGMPLNQERQPYGLKDGFGMPELVRDIYDGFDGELTRVWPGLRPTNFRCASHYDSRRLAFPLVFEPNKVEFVLVGCKCDQNMSNTIREDLSCVAHVALLNSLNAHTKEYWDYYIFPLQADYNHAIRRMEKDEDGTYRLESARYVTDNARTAQRRGWIRQSLENALGEIDSLRYSSLYSDREELAADRLKLKLYGTLNESLISRKRNIQACSE